MGLLPGQTAGLSPRPEEPPSGITRGQAASRNLAFRPFRRARRVRKVRTRVDPASFPDPAPYGRSARDLNYRRAARPVPTPSFGVGASPSTVRPPKRSDASGS